MLEMRFTLFTALSVDLRLGISQTDFFFTFHWKNNGVYNNITIIFFIFFFYNQPCMTANLKCHLEFFVTACKCISNGCHFCISGARQNFPALLKIEKLCVINFWNFSYSVLTI